ncbi:unnamed protein product, partial [Mycena citricolor]
WNQVTLLVQLNNPINVANGNIELYLNGVKALAQQTCRSGRPTASRLGACTFPPFSGAQTRAGRLRRRPTPISATSSCLRLHTVDFDRCNRQKFGVPCVPVSALS